jgi:hypothetical protein
MKTSDTEEPVIELYIIAALLGGISASMPATEAMRAAAHAWDNPPFHLGDHNSTYCNDRC